MAFLRSSTLRSENGFKDISYEQNLSYFDKSKSKQQQRVEMIRALLPLKVTKDVHPKQDLKRPHTAVDVRKVRPNIKIPYNTEIQRPQTAEAARPSHRRPQTSDPMLPDGQAPLGLTHKKVIPWPSECAEMK